MLKSLIITGHLIGIFLLSFIFSVEISITDTFPDSLKVGENYTVTTSVVKNDVSGFAKYQIDAPRGVVIKPIDLNGASFTFKDGKAKFIWMNLPSAPSFDIRYEVTLENGEIGSDKEVNSRFSYLVENERKIHEGPNHLLKVLGENMTATNTQSNTSSEISATRRITAEGDNKFLIEIDVNKLGVKGFAKIQDMIPDGFIATEVMNSEAIFTQSNNKVKLVWFDIPKNMSLNVSYQLEAPADFQGNADVTGKFHFMAGSDLKKIDVPSKSINIGGAIADNSEPNTNSTTSSSSDDNSTKTTTSVNSNDDNIAETIKNTSSSEETKKSIWDTNYTDDNTKDVGSTVNDDISKSSEAITSTVSNEASQGKEDVKKAVETNTSTTENSVNTAMDNSQTNMTNSLSNTEDKSIANSTDNLSKVNESIETTSGEIGELDNNNSSGTNSIDDLVDGDNPTTTNDDIAMTKNISNNANDVASDAPINSDSEAIEKNIEDKSSNSELVETYVDDQNNISTKKVAEIVDNTKSTTNQSVNNSSSEYSNINDASINDNNSNITQTADMTTAIAEPESTAVAKKEYAKDEVLVDANTLDTVSNMTDVDRGINFRVQILAGKNVVGKEYLRKRHNYYSQFTIENHEGWVKYTSGSFETYKTARDQRNMIRDQYNFNGPFVSAYNDGVRITVQEALMISKQQWYN